MAGSAAAVEPIDSPVADLARWVAEGARAWRGRTVPGHPDGDVSGLIKSMRCPRPCWPWGCTLSTEHPEHTSATVPPATMPRAAAGCWGHPHGVRLPSGGTPPAHGRGSRLAVAQGPAGRGRWQWPCAAGAAPAQLSLSVTLPVTVRLSSPSPLAPRNGADSAVLGPRGAHVQVWMGRVGAPSCGDSRGDCGWGVSPLLHAHCLQRLQCPHMDLCHVPAAREKGWYLALMAPNVKGPTYAWLDPSRLYCHPQVPSARGGWHPWGCWGGLHLHGACRAPSHAHRGCRCPRRAAGTQHLRSLPRACRTAWPTCCSPSRQTPSTWWLASMPWASSWVSRDAAGPWVPLVSCPHGL